jgi:hypothetical protein
MIRPLRTLLTVLFAAAASGLIALHEVGPQGLYSFDGHGHDLYLVSKLLLLLLCLTHVGLCLVMWAQRRRWDHAQASIFRFVALKAIFWGFFFATFPERPGVNLASTYLLVVLLLTTIDLDLHLFRRYVLGRTDERMTP